MDSGPDHASPGNRTDRTVRNAPATVCAVRKDLELGRGELEGVGGTHPGAEAAEHADIGVDSDHAPSP